MKNALEQFEHYIAYERRLAPGTVHNYIRDCEEFVTWCHSTPKEFRPALVSREDFSGWITHLAKDNKCKAASVNTKSSSVKAWFRWMADKKIIDRNPLGETYRLKTPAKLPTYIHTDNIQNIAGSLLARFEEAEEYAPKRDALLVVLTYATGLRLAEITTLTTDSLAHNLAEAKVLGKGNKERIVPIVNHLRPYLAEYLKSRSEFCRQNVCSSHKKALFLTSKRSPEGQAEVCEMSRYQIERTIQRELAAAGVKGKHSPHVLRHTFATQLLGHGADIREIQELLGHASLQATQIYTHTDIAHLREAYNQAHPRGRGK